MSSRLCGGSATAVLPPPVVFAKAQRSPAAKMFPTPQRPFWQPRLSDDFGTGQLSLLPGIPVADSRASLVRAPPLEAAGRAGNVDVTCGTRPRAPRGVAQRALPTPLQSESPARRFAAR